MLLFKVGSQRPDMHTQKFKMAHNFQELYEWATCHVTASDPIGFINHRCEPYLNGKFDLYILKLARTGAEIAIYKRT